MMVTGELRGPATCMVCFQRVGSDSASCGLDFSRFSGGSSLNQ